MTGMGSGSDRDTQIAASMLFDVFDLPTGSVCIRYSDPSNPEPFYLQRVLNDRAEGGVFGVHLIFGEFFDKLPDAEQRAAVLAEGNPVYVDPIAEAHRG